MTARLSAGACLSLTGRFEQFGVQAERGLRMWADECGADLVIVDDESEPAVLEARLPEIAANAELLFGPYSTVLMRAAIPVARQVGRLLFNHGGSGGNLDHPGRVVNVLTPASRYADPFVSHLATTSGGPLFTAAGHGAFGRHVIDGGRSAAQAAGLHVESFDPDLPPTGQWDLLSAGVYEDDVAAVRSALALSNPPRFVCSVAAGVASFADDVDDPDGVFGIGQWTPAAAMEVDAGMDGPAFLTAWRDRFGGVPDYPGVQAYAAGVIAATVARAAGSTDTDALWRAAAELDVRTVFGQFRLDPATGKQVGHESVLTQWCDGRQVTLLPGE